MTGHHTDFETFLKTKEMETWLGTIPREKSRTTYSASLFRYWRESLSAAYPSLTKWVATVKQEQRSKDNVVRKKWALDLQRYMNARVSKITGNPMGFSDKGILSSAVLGFLRFWVDDSISYDFKLERTVEEIDRQNKPAMSREDVRKLYEQAQSSRDKALVLCAANGLSPAELTQLMRTWKNWFPKDTTTLKAPWRANLVRGKKRFAYHTTFWEDACESLRTLHSERVQETGDSVRELFVDQYGGPLTQQGYEKVVVHLRERAGLFEPGKPFERQKVHAHGFRHFFRTQGKIHKVDTLVLEFALGHSGEKYGYDKSHLEPEWCERVESELRKLTEVLNIKTGHAAEYYASKESELIARTAKKTYKTLIESGALKPENLSEQVLSTIAKALGITFEKMVLSGGYASGDRIENADRLNQFEQLAIAVDLDKEVWARYAKALKVMKPTNAKAAWENHQFYWLRVEAGSDEYMQALADGFTVEDKEGAMRILRKPKESGA